MFRSKRFAGLILALGAAAAAAQPGTPHPAAGKVEVAIVYSYMRANATPGQCGCFGLNGGSAELALRVYRNLSLIGDLTGEHAGTTSIPGQSLSLLSYTVGPRFSMPIRQRTRVIPFVQGLVGSVHGFDAPFPKGVTVTQSANGLAVLAGGGIDVSINHSVTLRILQVDYGLNHLPNNANNHENLLRVAAGVVFHIR